MVDFGWDEIQNFLGFGDETPPVQTMTPDEVASFGPASPTSFVSPPPLAPEPVAQAQPMLQPPTFPDVPQAPAQPMPDYSQEFNQLQDQQRLLAGQQADALQQTQSTFPVDGQGPPQLTPLGQAREQEANRRKQFFEGYKDEETGQEVKGFNQLQDDLSQRREELREKKVDPNRWYNKQDTWQKVGMALMIGLTEYGNRLAGRSGNVAFDMLKNAVKNDIEAQKLNMQNLKDTYNLDRADLKDKLLMEQVKQAEAAKTEAQILQDAKFRLTEIEKRGIEPALQQQALQFKMQLDKMQNESAAKAWQMEKDLFTMKFGVAKEKASILKTQIKEQPGIPASADAFTKQIFAKVPKDYQKEAIKEKGYMEDAQKAQKMISDTFSEVEKMSMFKGEKILPFSESKAKMDTAAAQIKSSMQAAWKGVMSDQDLKVIGELMPTATDTSAQLKVKMDRMLELMKVNAKPTPILDGFQITGSEKKEDKKDFWSKYK